MTGGFASSYRHAPLSAKLLVYLKRCSSGGNTTRNEEAEVHLREEAAGEFLDLNSKQSSQPNFGLFYLIREAPTKLGCSQPLTSGQQHD
jgi:hypothetical protein